MNEMEIQMARLRVSELRREASTRRPRRTNQRVWRQKAAGIIGR